MGYLRCPCFLLLRGIGALDARLQKFRASFDEIQKHPEVTKRNYEEGIALCGLLQEQAVSSIENWTDIVPEADIKTLIGTITTLKGSLESKETELEDLKSRLTAATGKSEEDRGHLREQIVTKEKQILGLEAQLATSRARLAGIGSADVASIASTIGAGKGGLAQFLDLRNVGLGQVGLKGLLATEDQAENKRSESK